MVDIDRPLKCYSIETSEVAAKPEAAHCVNNKQEYTFGATAQEKKNEFLCKEYSMTEAMYIFFMYSALWSERPVLSMVNSK